MNVPKMIQDFQQQPQSLEGVLQYQGGMGKASLHRAASLIQEHRRVLITGMGASLAGSLPLVYELCAQGIEATSAEAGELLHFFHAGVSGQVVVIVSRSGASIEIIKLAELLAARNTIIAVTNEAESPLARAAQATILIGSQTDEMVALQTYTGTLLALCLLGAAVSCRLDAALMETASFMPNFAELVSRSLGAITSWDTFLDARLPVHLLARGASLASASEGALLFNEIAKHVSCAMPVASFRHGPVELVDGDFRGMVFAGEPTTRELDLALARDLHRFGGRVHVIGEQPQDLPEIGWSVLDTLPAGVRPIFEIVPVQIAAMRMAELRGVPLGNFRYTPQIALNEASFGKS